MTQVELIAKHLRSGQSITPIEALNRYGIFRLAARVADLRDAGLRITTTRVELRGKRFAQYQLRAGK
jgi:hypothetical protein